MNHKSPQTSSAQRHAQVWMGVLQRFAEECQSCHKIHNFYGAADRGLLDGRQSWHGWEGVMAHALLGLAVNISWSQQLGA